MQAQELTKEELKKELKALKKQSKKQSKKKKEVQKDLAKANKKYKTLKQKFEKLELSLKQHADAMLAVNTLLEALDNADELTAELSSTDMHEAKQTQEPEVKPKQAKTTKSKATESKPKQTSNAPDAKQTNRSKTTSKPKASSRQKKDDLKLIDGIGPTLERLLNEANIRTWSQLARTSQTKLKRVLSTAGPRLSQQNPESWPEQALLARDGRFEELKLLQENLKNSV